MFRTKLRTVAAAAGAIALLAVPAAANEDTTSTTFVVAATGGLSINAPETVSDTISNVGGTLALGLVTVTDDRNDLLREWDVYVDAGEGFQNNEEVITPEEVTYEPPLTLTLNGALNGDVTTGTARTLDSNQPVVSSSVSLRLPILGGALQSDSASWNPTLRVSPDGALPPGDYSGTITHSVS